MSKKKTDQDIAITRAISGSENGNPGIQIEPDYFERERLENLREQGFSVPIDLEGKRTEEEIDEYRRQKNLERLELSRCQLYPAFDEEGNPTYPGYDPDDRMPRIKSTIVWDL